jgi:hypothetical protein
MKLCVFCSANQQIDPDFFVSAKELGTWAAENGHTIVFGGHDAGLMHSVSKAARLAGGEVIGVAPRRIEEMGRQSPWTTRYISTRDLNDRKQIMVEESDAFIVLPGGIGTLDELFTVASQLTLCFHEKPIILWNMKGFWNSLITCLDDLHSRGVTRKQWRTYIQVADTLDDIKTMIAK